MKSENMAVQASEVRQLIAAVTGEAAEVQKHLEAAGKAAARLADTRAALARSGRAAGVSEATRLDTQPDLDRLVDAELRRVGLVAVPVVVGGESSMGEAVQAWADRTLAALER